jgi:plasmid stability protein
MMRTTLTLDDDVAAKLRAEARRTGQSFRDVVNDAIRRGLVSRRAKPVGPFVVSARDLGRLRPGLDLDNIADVLERIEGPAHR